jgi:hypothetical protein
MSNSTEGEPQKGAEKAKEKVLLGSLCSLAAIPPQHDIHWIYITERSFSINLEMLEGVI